MTPPSPAPPSAGWGATATQPAIPARPYQLALPPAARPQAPPPPPPSYSMGPPPEPPRQPPRRHDGRRSGSPLALWIILLVLLVGGGAAGVLIAHPFSHRTPARLAIAGPGGTASGTGTASPAASSTVSPSAPAVTERQAAASVATLLAQSVSDRAAISAAATDVSACGPSLTADPKVFGNAASSRGSLLASLAALPGRATLPPALVSDLTRAWQASVTADQAYAKWANDEIAKGCVPNDTADPGFQATRTPNAGATRYKTAFTAGWNPIAARYGLKRYQEGQL